MLKPQTGYMSQKFALHEINDCARESGIYAGVYGVRAQRRLRTVLDEVV